jgi:hypothetical protein
MNGGKVARGCSPDEGYHNQARCRDGRILEACTEVEGGDTAKIRMDCSTLGGRCFEFAFPGEDTVATCALGRGKQTEGIDVTCDGRVARLDAFGYLFRFDCEIMYGGTCTPGFFWNFTDAFDYDLGKLKFCTGNDNGCTHEDDHCEGDIAVLCLDAREYRFDCGRRGMACYVAEYTNGSSRVRCGHVACYDFPVLGDVVSDTCVDGVVTYCGEGGITEFSCVGSGFSDCLVSHGDARCFPNTENVCEQARVVQRRMCLGFEDCLPCICLYEGNVLEVGYNLGMPDRQTSRCIQPMPCEDQIEEEAQRCVDDQQTCDPCAIDGIYICRNPALADWCDIPID